MTHSGHEPCAPSEAPHRLLFRAVVAVQKHYSKKNSKTIGYRRTKTGRRAPFLMASAHAASSEQFLVSRLQAGERYASASYPISVPMLAVFTFSLDNFYEQKRGDINLRAGDTSNLMQGVEDSLQKAGIIKDDALITYVIAKRRFGLENEITIELFTDEDAASKPKDKKSKKPAPRP